MAPVGRRGRPTAGASAFSSARRGGGVQVYLKRLHGGARQITHGNDTYAYPT
jgi:hypothetical protein